MDNNVQQQGIGAELRPAPLNNWLGSCRRSVHQQTANKFTSVKRNQAFGSFLRNAPCGYFTPRFFSRVWGCGIVNWVDGVAVPDGVAGGGSAATDCSGGAGC